MGEGILLMEDWYEKYSEIDDMLDMSEITDNVELGGNSGAPVTEGVFGGQTTKAGIQVQDLQTVISNWAEALNKSAIAKSTGMPVRTPIAQYKGFAAEEFLKQTMKINALAKGIPNYRIGIYTNGALPDGSNLSGIDMHSDIVVYSRKWPWQKPVKVADAQVKMHKGPNAEKAYASDMAKEQYAGQQFIGGAGQGVNDKVHASLGNIEVTSDSITPDAAEQLAADMKEQNVSEYENAAEKQQQLNQINLGRAMAAGAITGAVLSTVGELCYLIKNRESLDENMFVQSVENILCGTIDGGVRGGAIMGSVQAVGKALGTEIPSNTLGAVPIMAAANISVDFAKDLFKCFVTHEIDTDDLLCNSINNSFSSLTGFGGAWAGGQAVGQIVSNSAGIVSSAKASAAAGASIGSALGPIGTIIGAAVGGFLIGLGANAVIKTSESDAKIAFEQSIAEINSHIEKEGCEKLYYFADTMSELSTFRLSFKDLLPCYNLISDLKEYNLHKKAIRHIVGQLDDEFKELNAAKENALTKLKEEHESRMVELKTWLIKQKEMLYGEYKDSLNTYIANSYAEYLEVYSIISGDVDNLTREIQDKTVVYSRLLTYGCNRNAVNAELNLILEDLLADAGDVSIVRPFLDKIMWFMQQDELLIGKQYISYQEALYMVNGVV